MDTCIKCGTPMGTDLRTKTDLCPNCGHINYTLTVSPLMLGIESLFKLLRDRKIKEEIK